MARRFCIFIVLLGLDAAGRLGRKQTVRGSAACGAPTKRAQCPRSAFPGLEPHRLALLRGGQLYLSLQDAIALALENNLDIELQRFAPAIAKSGPPEGPGRRYSARRSAQRAGAADRCRRPRSPAADKPSAATTPAHRCPRISASWAASRRRKRTLSILGTSSPSAGPRLPAFDPFRDGRA